MWTLIAFLIYVDGGMHSQTVEFRTEQGCKQAMADLQANAGRERARLVATCAYRN